MTNREFFRAIIRNEINEDVIEFAQQGLVKLDNKNANRKPTREQLLNYGIKEQILEFLKDNANCMASTIGLQLSITTSKASALCRQLVDEGKLTKQETKVPKNGKVFTYSIA